MRLEPGQHRQDAHPFGGIAGDGQRFAQDPIPERREPCHGLARQHIERFRLRLPADQRKSVALGGHHDASREAVSAELAMVDLLPDDVIAKPAPLAASRIERADPRPHIVEAVAQILRRWSLQPQRQRIEARAVEPRRQQASSLPQPLDLCDEFIRGRPAHGSCQPARFSRSARSSSMVRLRSIDRLPPSLCTKPTAATNGSMTWIFCSGVDDQQAAGSAWRTGPARSARTRPSRGRTPRRSPRSGRSASAARPTRGRTGRRGWRPGPCRRASPSGRPTCRRESV